MQRPAPFTMMRQLLQMMMMMLITLAFMDVAAAQLHCDPLTQYEMDGQCCRKCGPGKSMSPRGNCLQPECSDCRKNEYQDKYTMNDKCERQPYCDHNLNFEAPVHDSKKKTTCKCKDGYHCSDIACITCVNHTTCGPGYGAQSIGNHLKDTVCEKCPEGTFSSETSWEGVCQKYTDCGNGQQIQQSGTDRSDIICVVSARTREILIGVIVAFVILVALVGLCIGKRGGTKRKVKDCVESCLGEKHEPLPGAQLITTPTDVDELTNVDEESTLPEMQSSQEESCIRKPEEMEDPTDVGITDNGNLVRQENGKTAVLSRQESQPHAFTE